MKSFGNDYESFKTTHPTTHHPLSHTQVGLIGTLLSKPVQAWFAPLVETSSPLLENFTAFLAELEATFGETNRR